MNRRHHHQDIAGWRRPLPDFDYPPRMYNHPHAPPNQIPIPQRQFIRHDYSHDREPRVVPHVFEYEHGNNLIRDIPIINHPPPNPIVLNSAAQNPNVFENYRRLSEAGCVVNPSSLNDFMRQNILSNSISDNAQQQYSLNAAHSRSLHSQHSAMIDKLQSELADTRAELMALKKGGCKPKGEGKPVGGALPVDEELPEDTQNNTTNSDEGNLF